MMSFRNDIPAVFIEATSLEFIRRRHPLAAKGEHRASTTLCCPRDIEYRCPIQVVPLIFGLAFLLIHTPALVQVSGRAVYRDARLLQYGFMHKDWRLDP